MVTSELVAEKRITLLPIITVSFVIFTFFTPRFLPVVGAAFPYSSFITTSSTATLPSQYPLSSGGAVSKRHQTTTRIAPFTAIIRTRSDLQGSTMDETYDELAQSAIEKLRELRQKQDNSGPQQQQRRRRRRRRLWIGLAGGPGSGKSTVSEAVVERINAMGKSKDNKPVVSAAVLPMDGFHYSQAQLKALGMDMKRRGAPWTFDAEGMYRRLCPVVYEHKNKDEAVHKDDEGRACFPLYSREVSDPIKDGTCIDDSHDIIIVEGLYLLLGSLEDQLQDVNSPILQTIPKLADKGPRSEEKNGDKMSGTWVGEEVKRWKPITDLFDETWYVEAPGGREENEQRVVKRSLETWSSTKTKQWGGDDEQAAMRKVQYNDGPNGLLIECCRPYADRIIQTR